MNKLAAIAAGAALLLVTACAGPDTNKVAEYQQCIEEIRPEMQEQYDSGLKTAGQAQYDGDEFCGWFDLTDEEQTLAKKDN